MLFLTTIVNGILKIKHFPKKWKEAETVMLRENEKSPKFPQNLSHFLTKMNKIAEWVILKKHKLSGSCQKNSSDSENFEELKSKF